MKFIFSFIIFLGSFFSFSQAQFTSIVAKLNVENNTIQISQKIIFHNYSKDTLKTIYLHNWMNSYKSKDTPLSKRLIEDYDKSLYFANNKNRGYSKIQSIKNCINEKKYSFSEKTQDIIKINILTPLYPSDSISLKIKYEVKIPKANFTHYGRSKKQYNLRFWYLLPAVYNQGWNLMSNYNMDDIYSYATNYNIEFTLPNDFELESTLKVYKKTLLNGKKTFYLKGNNQSDIEIVFAENLNFKKFITNNLTLSTNLTNSKVDSLLSVSIVKRQISFIEEFIGKYPHKKLLINRIIYDKNPVYGLNQLPSILNPFNDLFKFDIQLFKAVTNKYINSSLIINKRKNYWFNDGLQTFIMLKYVEKYYPEVKAMGAISRIWGVRSYQLAKLNFNDKYAFVHQFSMRENLDQALNTHADSLSTFNRKIVNKYKAGLGLVYLNDYLKEGIVQNSLKTYYNNNLLLISNKKSFKEIITQKTKKDLSWFFNDYIKTNKKIDYTIKKVKIHNDSLTIGIKNKSNFIAPITIYGIKNKEIIYKKWVININNFSNITIPKGDFDRISLNYEAKYPELNLNNNWKNLKPSILNKPLQFRFMRDIDNPYYNQVFYNVDYDYNYYDGIILGLKLSNKTLFKKKWIYQIKPTFGFKSKKLSGTLNGIYTTYPKKGDIYKFRSGFSYSNYNYAPDLSYQRLSPFITFDFKRKSLRDVGGKYLSARYLIIKKEISKNTISTESDNYTIFNIRYNYLKPEIINNLNYNIDFQLSKKFSKLAFELEYRKLQKNNTQIDLRIFAGSFLNNKTDGDFFNYSLNRPSDYLFDFNYFGRSEDNGFLSQQIIISEGGFKSFFKNNLANKWMITSNNSIGIWRWVELYGDLGIYKSKKTQIQFRYDSGIRLNFVQHFFEVYFPIQSSNGLEIKQEKYSEKIRFVVTLNVNKIYNFIKRGFY